MDTTQNLGAGSTVKHAVRMLRLLVTLGLALAALDGCRN
jgi:hypothetical protein